MKKVLFWGIFCLTLLSSCEMDKKELLVIGHRGAMGYETENTLASIQKALDLGVDMIEIDVFKIKSGEIMVFHDQTLDRISNAPGNIEEYYIGDLKQVILDGNHRIPTLQEVLKLIDNKVALNIELKGTNTADRVNFITNYYAEKHGWSSENFVISSFNWDELKYTRELNPDRAIAVLTEDEAFDEAIAMAKELNAVAVNPWFKTLTAEKVKQIQNEGFKVYTYTVNEPEDLQQMLDFGVDGVFTNYPDRVQ
ncbi:glycerophosphodiester phosphodiesterase [Croceitalea vernalis]|uniref:Glycerophosphodiester phosphodiesterase family protein n=1 Tax=Croceitalea vernalis TaxID=3075599 RepID=A0ABU3BDE5_9FLAO|nr:glycerophosphodiester phosphodiesterase family protein [Croceitalea sp. P007]MDT0620090.1 glycerophosphodiester phosphodiesterase family protein [Croceitalea sp. P007]